MIVLICELKKGDFFTLFGVPYKVVKVTDESMFYSPFDPLTSKPFLSGTRAGRMGRRSQQRVTLVNKLFRK